MKVKGLIAAYRADVVPGLVDQDRRLRVLTEIEHHFGQIEAESITRAHVNGYAVRRRRRRPIGDGTLRLELSALVTVLNYGKQQKLIASVPYIHLPAQPPPRDRWLTRDEVAKLREHCAQRTRLFLEIAIATGGRPEAIYELTWDRVDFVSRTIDFRVPGVKPTRKRRAVVPMSEALHAILSAEIDRMIKYLRSRRSPYVLGGNESCWEGFHGACHRAGLKDVTPKTLRHTFATWAMQAGKDPWQVAGVLGDRLETVQARYAHHHPDYLRAAVEL